MHKYQTLIDGRYVDASAGRWFETQDPFTGETWAQIPRCDAQDVDVAVRAAHHALTTGPWSEMTATQRGQLMRRLGDLIARDARRLAEVEVRDNGKLFAEMFGQLSYVRSGTTTSAGWRTRSKAACCRWTEGLFQLHPP